MAKTKAGKTFEKVAAYKPAKAEKTNWIKFEILFEPKGTLQQVLLGQIHMPEEMKGQPRKFEAHILEQLQTSEVFARAASVSYFYRDYAAIKDAEGRTFAVFKNAKTPIDEDVLDSVFM